MFSFYAWCLRRRQAIALLDAADADVRAEGRPDRRAGRAARAHRGCGSTRPLAATSRTWAPTAAAGCYASAAKSAGSRPWPPGPAAERIDTVAGAVVLTVAGAPGCPNWRGTLASIGAGSEQQVSR